MRISWPRVGVRDLGVELHAVDAPLGVLERGDRHLAGARRDPEARRARRRSSRSGSSTRPASVGSSPNSGRRRGDLEAGAAVLAPPGAARPRRRAAGRSAGRRSRCRARARRRRTPRRRSWARPRRAPTWAAAEDDAPRARRGQQLAHDRHGRAGTISLVRRAALPHPPGDQLRVLRPEVDDQRTVSNGWARSEAIGRPGQPCDPGADASEAPIDPSAHADALGPLQHLPSVCSAGATMTSAFWNSLTDS